MTSDDRERYANELINHARLVAGAVHSDGPDVIQATIGDALALQAPSDTNPVVALVVTLAAMVPTDKPVTELLAWTKRIDEYQRLRRAGFSAETAAVVADHAREAAA